MARQRKTTSTSNFGVGAREAHDAAGFYQRFHPPIVSNDATVLPPDPVVEPFVCGDSRAMTTVRDGSVALVVTSPPYFAGKKYEEELERDGVPSSYLEYLQMLTDVFADCVRVLEPGGRLAVNVANLGRKPYRSLSADVIRILERLGLLLRGEVIWQKAEGAGGSCAWGSFRSAANPVLRDVTERVIIASKGRFDRALTVKERAARGLPHRNTLVTDDFLALTLDVWAMPTESAKRVGHPAPFPVELPAQLIRLYTYEGDLVLDPFMGSGSALIAAAALGRRYVGYDLDPAYVDLARGRFAQAMASVHQPFGSATNPNATNPNAASPDPAASPDSARPDSASPNAAGAERSADGSPPAAVGQGSREEAVRVAAAAGDSAEKLATRAVEQAGFGEVVAARRVARAGLTVDLTARDGQGVEWRFEIPGPFTSYRGGLARSEAVWRSLGRVAAMRGQSPETPVVLLATEVPRPGSDTDLALQAGGPSQVFDVIDLFSAAALERLAAYAAGGAGEPLPGFWHRPPSRRGRPRIR